MLIWNLPLIKNISGIGFLLSITVKWLMHMYLDYRNTGSVNPMLYFYAPGAVFKKYPGEVQPKYSAAKALCNGCMYSFWICLAVNLVLGISLLFIR